MSLPKVTLALLLIVCIVIACQAASVEKHEKSSVTLEDVASEGFPTNNRVKRQFGALGLLLGGGGYNQGYGGYNQGYYNQGRGNFWQILL